jgi:hypothetical protein
VQITTAAPIIPRPIVEAISNDFGIPFEDGRIVFSALIDRFSGAAREIEFCFEHDDGDYFDDDEPRMLEERTLSEDEHQQLGYFTSELDKLDSVNDFLARASEDADDACERGGWQQSQHS